MASDSSAYDRLAPRYITLFEDPEVSGEAEVARLREHSGVNLAEADVLDCSCGIGLTAIALSRIAHSVTGSDASEGMLSVARDLAREDTAEVRWVTANWSALPQLVTASFDLIVCLGNSICHCDDREEMQAALANMSSMLREGGTLIVDSRDWESLLDDDPDYWVLDAKEGGAGLTVPMYDWRLNGLGAKASLTLLWIWIAADHSTDLESYEFSFTPFPQDQLVQIVREIGLRPAVIRYDPGSYWVVGRLQA